MRIELIGVVAVTVAFLGVTGLAGFLAVRTPVSTCQPVATVGWTSRPASASQAVAGLDDHPRETYAEWQTRMMHEDLAKGTEGDGYKAGLASAMRENGLEPDGETLNHQQRDHQQ